ncbi:hypothetical protein GCM10007852_21020 [Agaribacter marinus]|uniref:Uncharacterized protein n=1 Tax=Agaribacter marinus TaxID=1431249 RepID=A0AA37WK90_9ALTE|nr:hypothetical protein GCM10007852_21020 [Agaribacter marinus]
MRVENKLLALTYSDNTYDLPTRKNLPNESGQCAAHRAVWEDTGLNVQVSAPLGVLENGSWLYACHMHGGFDGSEINIPVPSWANKQLLNIAFIDPFTIDVKQWRQPDDFINVRDGYIASKQLQKPQLDNTP